MGGGVERRGVEEGEGAGGGVGGIPEADVGLAARPGERGGGDGEEDVAARGGGEARHDGGGGQGGGVVIRGPQDEEEIEVEEYREDEEERFEWCGQCWGSEEGGTGTGTRRRHWCLRL